MRVASQFGQPIFSAPVRWTARVLAWMAFGAAVDLAWHAVNQTHVAGCGVSGQSGCDLVLSSQWSMWLGMPVAVLGLACYAALAGLSVLLGRQDLRAYRWIVTAFLMLSLVSGVASLWFIGIQLAAIGRFCLFCMVADLCGIALGGLALWSIVRLISSPRGSARTISAQAGLMALRSALPMARDASPIAAPRRAAPIQSLPSMAVAISGAAALLVLLIGGQLLFPTKMFDVQKLALPETIDMASSTGEQPDDIAPSLDAQTRVTMRVPADSPSNETDAASNDSTAVESETNREGDPAEPTATGNGPTSSEQTTAPGAGSTEAPPPQAQRIVKFLGGKLPLDVYKHPLIGSPEAPHVLVEMVSYDCAHCRKTHRLVKQAQSRYGRQLAIIVIPIPLEQGCNKLVTNAAASHPGACTTARMALGVARIRPAAFAKFHDWLMTDLEKPPGLDSIVSKAYNLVDRSRLREFSRSDELKRQIEQYVDLFATLQKQNAGKKEFGLPIQILGDHVVSGSVEKAEDIYKAWEEHLGVKPR